MRRTRQPARLADSLLRVAIRQMPAVPALAGSVLILLAPAAHAMTLGDISLRSALGQRLNATIPVRLGTGESLRDGCVTSGQQQGDLRRVPAATVTTPLATRPGMYELEVATSAALYEPMYELELKVQCDGSPVMVRQYVLMLDLPGSAPVPAAAPLVQPAQAKLQPAPVASPGNAIAAPPRGTPAVTRPAGRIDSGSTYRVARGDTLSTIAARVQDRGVPLAALAGMIQDANPDAFIRNDANLIKLGSEIVIPDSRDGQPAAALDDPAMDSAAMDEPASTETLADAVPGAMLLPPAAGPVSTPVPASTAAVVTTTAPATPELPADAPFAAPAKEQPATAPAAAADADTQASPVLAALSGIVFGLVISSLLWFRGQRASRKRPAAPIQPKPASPPEQPTADYLNKLSPLATRQVEPGFSVSYTPAEEDALAVEFADPQPVPAPAPAAPPARHDVTSSLLAVADITSELEELFDGTDTTIQKRLDAEKAVAALGETVEQPRPAPLPEEPVPTIDIGTLAAEPPAGEQQQSQTLLDALTLLERDYEEELTASQVLDMSAVREALGQEFDEATQVNPGLVREASGGRKTSG